MTGQEIIIAAMESLEIIHPGETPSSDELTRGLVLLNNMITGWNEMLAMNLAGQYASALYSFTPLSTYATLATASTASLGFQRAYMYNLAYELGSFFGVPIPQTVADGALSSRQTVMTLAPPKG
jgi:hypothetical protein